jgi:hypothetical protein
MEKEDRVITGRQGTYSAFLFNGKTLNIYPPNAFT